MNSLSEYILVYIIVSSTEEAKAMAKTMVEERLAACANILPEMQSVYWWEGKVHEDKEIVLILKSLKANFKKIEKKVKALHTYDCPCIVALPITHGAPEYLKWLSNETRL